VSAAGATQYIAHTFYVGKKGKTYIDVYLLESEKYNIALIGIAVIEIVEPDSPNGRCQKMKNIGNNRFGLKNVLQHSM
jgi:hypothetical protein